MAQTLTRRSIHTTLQSQSILIVGCGIAGPALANFLLSSSRPAKELPCITILERSPSFIGSGQNIDIRDVGRILIRKLSVEDAIRASTTGEQGVRMVDEHNQIWAESPVDKTGKIETGTSDVEILRGRLAEILFQKASAVSDEVVKRGGPAIEFIFGDSLETLHQDDKKVHVRLAKAGERSFDLVVGADGQNSRTRTLAFGSDASDQSVKPLGMYGAFFSMPSETSDGQWRRWFHAPGRTGIMIRPSGQPDKSTVFITLAPNTNAQTTIKPGRNNISAQKEFLKTRLRNVGWESERIIRGLEIADDFYFEALAQIKMNKWSKDRVVLLGDAGYCGSPFSGMGTTMALSGAYHLAGCLSQTPNNYKTAFENYESKMRPLVDRAQHLPLGIPLLIHPNSTWGVWIMRVIAAMICRSGVVNFMFKFKMREQKDRMEVEDYGIKTF